MKDSSSIRKSNKQKIKCLLFDGSLLSKQQIAYKTGLSVATCNTLLNEMESRGEVIGEKNRVNEVGPSTVFYRLNEDYEYFICLHIDVIKGRRVLDISLVKINGKRKSHIRKEYETLDKEILLKELKEVSSSYLNVKQIIFGIPGLFTHGKIEHCDCSEINGWECKKEIEKVTKIPTYVENDMYLKAFGYYKKGKKEEIVTLAYFPEKLLPGTVSVANGIVLKGANNFAGMTGFLPFDIDRETIKEQLQKETCHPLITKSIASIIVLINPSVIVLSGSLIDEDSYKWIENDIKRWIPEAYLPRFVYEEDFEDIYLEGMYQKASSLKEEEWR